MITDAQVRLLNDLYKTTPPLRAWYNVGEIGLGDVLKEQQNTIATIPGATTPVDIGAGADGVTPFTVIEPNTSYSITITVQEAFETGASLSVGSVSNHSLIVGTSDFDITAVGTYAITGQLLDSSTEIFTYLDSNGSVTGQLIVNITR